MAETLTWTRLGQGGICHTPPSRHGQSIANSQSWALERHNAGKCRSAYSLLLPVSRRSVLLWSGVGVYRRLVLRPPSRVNSRPGLVGQSTRSSLWLAVSQPFGLRENGLYDWVL